MTLSFCRNEATNAVGVPSRKKLLSRGLNSPGKGESICKMQEGEMKKEKGETTEALKAEENGAVVLKFELRRPELVVVWLPLENFHLFTAANSVCRK